jgi:Ran GTPase-activating protein 1
MKYICKIPGKLKWDDPSDLEQMISEIKENKSKITSLELSHCSIGTECAKVLSQAISLCENLTSVNYRDLFVSRLKEDLPISLKYLMEAISTKKIQFLDLSDNAFGPTAIPYFDFFLRTCTNLEILELENNGLGPEGAEMVCGALLQNDKIKLKKIKINRNRLEEKGALALAKVIEKMKTFEHIEVFQNGISTMGMKNLFLSLKDNTNLKILKINDNFTKNALKDLIDILPNFKDLNIIDISDSITESDLGNKLGVELFKALSSLENLEEIYCNYNEIIDKKAQKEIFENLKNFKKIKILQLKGNEINKNLLKEYTKNITIDKFECYSENEEELEEEEEAEVKEKEKIDKLTEDIDKININK